jgi:hypothetical protein
MKQTDKILICTVSFLLLAFIASMIISCGGSSGGATTANYVGTQSPGDYWTWAETTNSSSQVNFAAVDKAIGYTYSGTETSLSGNSSGITKLTVTSSTDPSIQSGLPTSAYEINIPNTMVIAAVPPFATVNQPNATTVSEHGPVVAAAQGSCPVSGTTTNVDWIMMPRQDWCPANNTANIPTTQAGTTCSTADSAYGTASIAVNTSGNYSVNVTAYQLSGTQVTAPTLSQCSCSSGVIQCTDNNSQAVKIAFTPSGIFIMDTANYGVAGVVQSNITTTNFSGFYANGNTFKGISFWSFDDPNGWPGIPETAPASMTTDGTHLTYQQYANIDAGTLSQSSTSVALNGAAQTVAPGLITTTFTNCDGSTSPMAIALTNINGKYVAFAIGYSPGQGPGNGGNCPDYTHGFNVLAVQQ